MAEMGAPLDRFLDVETGVGLGSGESFQLGFAGSGWVLVQPSEGRRAVQA
jgi:uncharacterized protein (AIM24 family)